MQPLLKILSSSTAWLGALVAAITTYSQTTGWAVSPWLSAAIVGAYGIKELGNKIADIATQPKQQPQPKNPGNPLQ